MTSVKSKIFILVTDGVSLRHFAFTNFYKQANDKGFDVVFWHNTPFDLEDLGFNQIRLIRPKLHWFTNILKNARKRIEVSRFVKRSHDSIYYKYLFPLGYKGLKPSIKSVLTQIIVCFFNSEKGLQLVRKMINGLERKTMYYKHCKSILEIHKPDLVYCTSQRTVLAIAPLLATKALKIPSVCFIFSWDNLPKATLDVTADYYHVWSQHMKDELLHYHPFITEHQVKITGTPQFEPHYNASLSISKQDFYSKYNLDSNKKYICYSGDDVTTSPKDPLYLRDVAQAIRMLNEQGYNFGLIFRRCPVDFSDRYDRVITNYKDVIVVIEPIWTKLGEVWDTILPLPEDMNVLANLARHTEAVINLGSSMVFDFVAHDKPCMYMNYNYLNTDSKYQLGVYVYDYVHFRSKPCRDVVVWLNHPDEISNQIANILSHSSTIVNNADHWYKIINQHPPELASKRIWDSIEDVLNLNND